jgi:hypothetical protein
MIPFGNDKEVVWIPFGNDKENAQINEHSPLSSPKENEDVESKKTHV